MIVKIPLVLAICVVWIKDATGASFSKVFVQSVNPDYPVEYVQYGAPAVPLAGQQLAQLTAPVGSVVPYPSNYASPCGPPCAYPSQLGPIAPSPNIVQYQSQNLPVVVAPARSDPSGYEYSYVVYDDQTGDHKAQREISDGSVVRGGYSFLQPDGFVREVQYVADDSQGFKAIVKNFLPATVEGGKKDAQTEKSEPDPCHDIKKEQLKAQKCPHEELHEEHGTESQQAEPSHENLVHYEDKSESPHETGSNSNLELNNGAHAEEHTEPQDNFPETHAEVINEENPHEEQTETPEEQPQEIHETQEVHEEHVEVHDAEPHEPLKAESNENAPTESSHKEDVPHDVESSEKSQETHAEQEESQMAVPDNANENSNILVPYNDIIRCVQAAINGANVVSPQKPQSPLTYIILNKPC